MTGPKGPYHKILTGLYQDSEGNAVFNAAEILIAMNLEDTPENRIGLIDAIKEVAQEAGFTGEDLIYRNPGDPTWRREAPQ